MQSKPEDLEWILVQLLKWKYVVLKTGERLLIVRIENNMMFGKSVDENRRVINDDELCFWLKDISQIT